MQNYIVYPKSRSEAFTGVPDPVFWIYFVYAPDLNRVKIGISTDPNKRLITLSQQSPCAFVMLGTMEGDYGVEKSLHNQFAEYRVHGEWFNYSPEIKSYVERHAMKPVRVDINDFMESLGL